MFPNRRSSAPSAPSGHGSSAARQAAAVIGPPPLPIPSTSRPAADQEVEVRYLVRYSDGGAGMRHLDGPALTVT